MSQVAFEASVQLLSSDTLTAQSLSTQLPNPAYICITQQEFAHDIATMEWWGGDVTSIASGTPLLITFGSAPTLRSFYGYVNHGSRVNNSMASTAMGRNALCVTAIGASWLMKDRSTATYKNMTSTQIVQQIAAQFGLGSSIVSHPTVWPIKNQGGQSYWRFCTELMREIGYTFYCNGIQLVAKPRNTDPSNLTSLTAVYDYRLNPLGLPVFNPTVGSNNPTGGQLRTRQLANIDPRLNRVVYSTVAGSNTTQVLGVLQENPPFTDIETYTTDSTAQLSAKLQGVAQSNQLYITATATGTGNASLAQGSYVFVQNANGSQNGLWVTTKVEHRLSPKTYQMDICFGRDSIGSTNFYQVMANTQPPPQAQLLNDVWQVAA